MLDVDGEVRRDGEISVHTHAEAERKNDGHGDELDEGLERRCVGTLGRWGWARDFLGSGGWNYGLSLVWRKGWSWSQLT